MDLNELMKLAAQDINVRDALIVLSKAMEKNAANKTSFDETTPAQADTLQQKVSGSGISGTAQAPGQSVPAMVDQAAPGSTMPPEMVATPQEMGPEGALDPSEEAAKAAQIFLGPIFEAASQGDPNAQQIIAQAAGQVAKAAAEASIGALMAGQGNQPPVSPEEQVANQIVPPVPAGGPGIPPTKEKSGKNTPDETEKQRASGTQTDEGDKHETTKTSDDKTVAAAMIILANAIMNVNK